MRGLVGEYLVEQYLISEGYKIRSYGHPPSTHFSSDEEIEIMNKIKDSDLKDISSQWGMGWTDEQDWWEHLEKNRVDKSDSLCAGYDDIKPFFYAQEKTRKNDVFYFAEHNKNDWLKFIGGKVSIKKDNFFRLIALSEGYVQSLYFNKKFRKKYKITDNQFSGWPGKFDIIAYKEGGFFSKNNYYAFEIKVNGGQLNNAQRIRLGLLQHYGFNAQLINIKINEEQMMNAIENDVYEYDEIIFKDDVQLDKVKFFRLEDFEQHIKNAHSGKESDNHLLK